jgi:hypothetical protein
LKAITTLPLFVSEDEALDAFVLATADTSPLVREAAFTSLADFAQKHTPRLLTVFSHGLGDFVPEVRKSVLVALRRVDIDWASKVVPEVVRLLNDQRPDVRLEAVSTLEVFGDEAKGALRVLGEMLQHEQDAEVHPHVMTALLKLDPKFDLILPLLERITLSTIRQRILHVLRSLGADARGLRKELESRWSGRNRNQPDGPNDSRFWWRGEDYPIRRTAYTLLTHLWGHDSVPVSELSMRVWNRKKCSKDQLKSALHDLNHVLLDAGVPWHYGRNEDFVIKVN